jgi:hypothetical protein
MLSKFVISVYSYNEMDRACSTKGGEEESIWDIDGNARKKENTDMTKT